MKLVAADDNCSAEEEEEEEVAHTAVMEVTLEQNIQSIRWVTLRWVIVSGEANIVEPIHGRATPRAIKNKRTGASFNTQIYGMMKKSKLQLIIAKIEDEDDHS